MRLSLQEEMSKPTAKESGARPWISAPRTPNPGAVLRLFCFPYAGGGAGIFRGWERRIPPSVEICPVQLPGRERRLREKLFTRARPLVEATAEGILGYLNKPFAFFGHSMGAILGFEIAHLLRTQLNVEPVHLFLSGRRAPQFPGADKISYNLPEAEFREELRRLNGTPVEVLDNPELMQLISPIIRADFEVCQTHENSDRQPLSCPITGFGGLNDNGVSREQIEGWREHTTGPFSLRMLPGGHFFLRESESVLLQVIARDLLQSAKVSR